MLFVVGLTGLAGSGKSEVSKYLVKRYGFEKLVFSDILREEAKNRKLLNNENYEQQKYILSKLGETLRKETGRWDILAVKLVNKIKDGNYDRVVVDGFRSAEEAKLFKNNFEKFHLVLIETDELVRFERRRKEDPKATLEDMKTRDKRDIEELGLGKVIKLADSKVQNNDDIKTLHEKLDKIMENITG